jgi:hypothetical protein
MTRRPETEHDVSGWGTGRAFSGWVLLVCIAIYLAALLLME